MYGMHGDNTKLTAWYIIRRDDDLIMKCPVTSVYEVHLFPLGG